MLKLLVVDDNNRDRRVAREMSIWQDLNIQVIGEAANGHLALEQIEHLGVPDIVLTDVSMPYMDGMTLSKEPLINHRYFITIDKSVRESSLSRAFPEPFRDSDSL